MLGAGVALSLDSLEGRDPVSRRRPAGELGELADRQHLARRHEPAGLVERVVARHDGPAEIALVAVDRAVDALHVFGPLTLWRSYAPR